MYEVNFGPDLRKVVNCVVTGGNCVWRQQQSPLRFQTDPDIINGFVFPHRMPNRLGT